MPGTLTISNSVKTYAPVFSPSRLPGVKIWLHLNDTGQYSEAGQWDNSVDIDNPYTNASDPRSPTLLDGTNLATRSLSFDGGDYLLGVLASNIGAGSLGGTLAIVYTNADWDNSTAQVIIGDDNTNNSFIRTSSSTAFTFKGYDGTDSSSKGLTTDLTLVDDKFYVFIITVSSIGNIKLYINGALQSDSPTFNPAACQLIVQEIGAKNGASQPLTGKIKEIVATSQVITENERIKLNNYLGKRHGIF
jgi:hypothetical protein